MSGPQTIGMQIYPIWLGWKTLWGCWFHWNWLKGWSCERGRYGEITGKSRDMEKWWEGEGKPLPFLLLFLSLPCLEGWKVHVPTLRKLLCSSDGAGGRHIILGVEKALMGGAHQSLYQWSYVQYLMFGIAWCPVLSNGCFHGILFWIDSFNFC